MAHLNTVDSLEAKICVLGAQGVGKTSLVHRYVSHRPPSPSTPSTIGASFLTKRTFDPETSTPLKLQIWDTAGQERFRSIARLYYRGASAVILVYAMTSRKSFEQMKTWMVEVREQLGDDVVVHVVGTMADVVEGTEGTREVGLEEVVRYVAEEIAGREGRMERIPSRRGGRGMLVGSLGTSVSKRSSGFGWESALGWDCCHEVSAQTGEGIDEVFRVVTRKLVDQHLKRLERESILSAGVTPFSDAGTVGGHDYFGYPSAGSFRLGGDPNKRRSWLGLPTTPSVGMDIHSIDIRGQEHESAKKGCC